jgi:hypothetical protein
MSEEKTYTAKDIEALLAIPCCHTTGMHDPRHFEKKKYVCDSQARGALENLCRAIGINPITKSRKTCYWCYSSDRGVQSKETREGGEGLAFIWPNEEVVHRLEDESYHGKPTRELAEMVGKVLTRQPRYASINKDFQREWKKYIASNRKENFGRNSEASHVSNHLSKFRFRVSGKKSEGYQSYELQSLVEYALRHSKRIYGL